ncbi:hypothetical protein Q4610_08445 [Sphingobium sp. HBC34]|uniref:Transposase n=1 Tax=Sphingobium cyanobacteriorum TaxID=3063954 RepID=A0ABT8ZKM8_9SPHN|nr:hypothetical protein [Sphingobium sp. HBC34]MDO7835078.1 hypothetical protein [Sphingobium sp. HBC34]
MADRIDSARSILGETGMNQRGAGRFKPRSAGSQPKGEVQALRYCLTEPVTLFPTAPNASIDAMAMRQNLKETGKAESADNGARA